MHDTLPKALDRISRYRDRFSGWGLVVSLVSVITALWTTAPTLDVEVPLVGGAKVGINVGYVMMAGMPLLMFAMAWVMVPLLAMRRLQEATLQELEANHGTVGPTQSRELLGPFAPLETDDLWTRSAAKFFEGVRYFVLFVCPVLGIIWIGEEYFMELQAYDKSKAVASLLTAAEQNPTSMNTSRWNIPTKERISFVEYFFRSKPYDAAGNKLKRFAIENSDLERNCAQIWVRDHLADERASQVTPPEWKKRVFQDLQTRTTNVKCVIDAFPRFELAINSWINVVSLLLSVWIAAIGWRSCWTAPMVRRIDAIEAKCHSSCE